MYIHAFDQHVHRHGLEGLSLIFEYMNLDGKVSCSPNAPATCLFKKLSLDVSSKMGLT